MTDDASALSDGSVSDHIRLEIPARADLLILARLVAAAVAARAGLGVDDIDDLRLAVDELCLSVMGEEGSGTLTLELRREPGAVEISCGFSPSGDGPSTHHQHVDPDLSAEILSALVDEHTYEPDPRHSWARLRKLAGPAGSRSAPDVSPAVPRPFA